MTVSPNQIIIIIILLADTIFADVDIVLICRSEEVLRMFF